MAETRSEYRLTARRRIAAALARLPADADLKAKRKALRDAYPVSWPRSGWLYQCWLKERRAALGPKEPAGPAVVDWEVVEEWHKPFFVRVRCGWCVNRLRTRGCLACGPWVDELAALLASPDFTALLAAVRADAGDRLPRLVLADWLDERGNGRLAELFRATTTGDK